MSGAVSGSGRSNLFFAAAALALAAIIPALGVPVYFRTDDVQWLGWAAGHANPLAAFLPRETLFGYYRPVPAIAWWGLYRLFGFHPLGYQLSLAAVAVLAMLPLYSICRRFGGAPWAGFLGVALFHAAFFNLLYYVYWFSALTFGLELLFLLAAFDAFTDGPRYPGRPVRFVVFALLAGLSKQPALVLVPVVGTLLMLLNPRKFPARLLWIAGIWVVSIFLLLLSPFITHQPNTPSGIPGGQLAGFLFERYRFYADLLLGSAAGPVVAAAAAAAVGARIGHGRGIGMRVAWTFLAGGAALGLAFRLAPVYAFPIWLVLLAGGAWALPKSRPWVAGFLVVFLLLLRFDVYVATYLLEPAAILTPALTLWLAPLFEPAGAAITHFVESRRPGRDAARLPRVAAVGVPALVAAALIAAAYPRVPALKTMRDVRMTFRLAADELLARAPRNATIGMPSYDEIDQSYEGIRERPLAVRVGQLKTMDGSQLGVFLRLRGRPDLKVRPVRDAAGAREPRLLFATGDEERAMLEKLPGAREIRSFRRGAAVTTIYSW